MVLSEVAGAAVSAPAPVFAFGDILQAIVLFTVIGFGLAVLVRKLRGPIVPRPGTKLAATDVVLAYPLPLYDRVFSCDVCLAWWSIVGTILVWGYASKIPLTAGTAILGVSVAVGAEGLAVMALAALSSLKGEKIPPPV